MKIRDYLYTLAILICGTAISSAGLLINPYSIAAPVAASPLLVDLKGYWKLDETNGIRYDSHGTNHLTDNNTVTSAAGKLSNAAQFDSANTEYLSLADNASLSTGDVDFFASAWIFIPSLPFQKTIFGKGTEWALATSGSSGDMGVAIKGDFVMSIDCNFIENTWYYVSLWFDSAANTVSVAVNNGTPTTSGSILPPNDSDHPFTIGVNPIPLVDYFSGLIDEVYYRVGSIPDAAGKATLYGAGTPPAYPFTTP
jgi:hypothetical protein